MSYPGGKGASGAYQKIISWMPPHLVYVEAFAGEGYIFKTKKPAKINMAIDLDKECLKKITGTELVNIVWKVGENLFQTLNQSALEWLEKFNIEREEQTLIYFDPPYLPSTLSRPPNSVRNGQRYKHKFSAECHQRLLELITPLKCYVMISGYASAMYDRALCAPTWTRKTFMASTRGGMREEVVWMNFNPDAISERHDYRFIGDTFRERERIQKMQKRWKNKFGKLSATEQRAMLEHLQSSLKNA